MRFEDKLAILRALHPISVTSWFRTRAHNKAVGGAANSKHLSGQAVDVRIGDDGDRSQFKADAERLGLWVLEEDDHIHVQES